MNVAPSSHQETVENIGQGPMRFVQNIIEKSKGGRSRHGDEQGSSLGVLETPD